MRSSRSPNATARRSAASTSGAARTTSASSTSRFGRLAGAGIGGALLREIMEEAAQSGKSASIHVERDNRALGLYQRLGFERVDDHGVYYLMKWSAAVGQTDQPKTAS